MKKLLLLAVLALALAVVGVAVDVLTDHPQQPRACGNLNC
jgi:hypothetical protein